jgi:ribosome-binding factor A
LLFPALGTGKVSKFVSINPEFMVEGKRQKQVAGVLHEELTGIFRKKGLSMIDGALVSISGVKVTPDLLEARVYISIFQSKDPLAVMKKIDEASFEIKRDLTSKVKHQLRRMPELRYYPDDTLDHVFRIEELFRKLDDDKENPSTN